MNCKDAEREMLLAETGELSRRKLDELEAHISACAACSGRRQGVRQIVAAARHALPGGDPSPAVIARIRAALPGAGLCGRPRPAGGRMVPARPEPAAAGGPDPRRQGPPPHGIGYRSASP